MAIGTLNEGPLHAALKAMYAANGGEEEVSVDGFVADAVRNGTMYEIQTGSFSGMGRKLDRLLALGPVVLVHPIAEQSHHLKVASEAGGKTTRRKSPKRGALVHIVNELVYIPRQLAHPNLSVDVVLTHEEEVRFFDPDKRRGRGGWRVHERRLVDVVDTRRIAGPADPFDFLREDLPDPFSTRDLPRALDEHIAVAQKLAYCLRLGGVAEVCGKDGNALLYTAVAGA